MTDGAEAWGSLPRRLSATVADWLVDAVAPGARPGSWAPGSSPPSGLASAARIHGVEGWVCRRAAQSGVGVPEADTSLLGAIARHQRALSDLSRSERALTASSVPFLVVKGPAVARWYAEPGLRSYVDLDLLVAPDTLGSALTALEEAGFAVVHSNWAHLQSMREHEVLLLAPSGGALDLHWSLGPAPLSRDRTPTFEHLIARSVELALGATPCRGLGDADALCHISVHAAAAGGHRLVWLADLRAGLEATSPDPADLWSAAHQWGAGPALAVMLRRAEAALGPLAPWVTRESAGLWAGLDRLVSGFTPPERVGMGRSAARMLARSSRSTSARSLAALAGKGLLAARPGARVLMDPAMLHDLAASRVAVDHAVDRAERAEFLSWVATARR